MATLTNKQREAATVTAAVAAAAVGGVAPTSYAALVTPYLVWAAIFECGITRKTLKHRAVSKSLFQDDFETCLD